MDALRRRRHDRPELIDRAGVLRNLSRQVPELHLPALRLGRPGAAGPARCRVLPRVSGHARLGLPCTGIRTVVGIGLHGRNDAAEAGRRVTAEPIVSMKATPCLSRPADPPAGSEKTER